jgi:hypothetical protein
VYQRVVIRLWERAWSQGMRYSWSLVLRGAAATSVGVRIGPIVVEALEGHSVDLYNLNVCRETYSI